MTIGTWSVNNPSKGRQVANRQLPRSKKRKDSKTGESLRITNGVWIYCR